jgi:hypothetical protein
MRLGDIGGSVCQLRVSSTVALRSMSCVKVINAPLRLDYTTCRLLHPKLGISIELTLRPDDEKTLMSLGTWESNG